MNAKLTLRMDEELIAKAKRHAQRTGKSVSAMVADYFGALERDDATEASSLAPVTRSLYGLLAGATVDEEDYRAYLLAKHQ